MASVRRKPDAEDLQADPFERVCRAMKRVDRSAFVPSNLAPYARSDAALPIGYGKTISKPSTIAFMLGAMEIQSGEQVLEIGCGSGFVLAVLCEMGARTHGVEVVPDLAQSARRRLDRLGYPGVLLKCGDGKRGWEEYAPFDVVVVSAALAGEVPKGLLNQLSDRGRLIAPVAVEGGAQGLVQRLEYWQAVPEPGGKTRYAGECVGDCEFVLAD